MEHLRPLVDILNGIDQMYGNKEYNYSVIENENEEVTGIAQYSAEIDPLNEICEARSEIGEFEKTLLRYKLHLIRIENQIELDRKFPITED